MWKTTEVRDQLETIAKRLDFRYYSKTGRCLEVERGGTSSSVQITTSDCLIELDRRPVNLRFTVVRNLPTEPWGFSQVAVIP